MAGSEGNLRGRFRMFSKVLSRLLPLHDRFIGQRQGILRHFLHASRPNFAMHAACQVLSPRQTVMECCVSGRRPADHMGGCTKMRLAASTHPLVVSGNKCTPCLPLYVSFAQLEHKLESSATTQNVTSLTFMLGGQDALRTRSKGPGLKAALI